MAKWLTLDTFQGPIRVEVVRSLGAGCHAAYYSNRSLIKVAWGPRAQMESALLHELLHVCLGWTTREVRKRLLKSAKVMQEEVVVGLLEPFMYYILSRNGMWRLPKPPKPKKKKG